LRVRFFVLFGATLGSTLKGLDPWAKYGLCMNFTLTGGAIQKLRQKAVAFAMLLLYNNSIERK